jgi:hypothetical protein
LICIQIHIKVLDRIHVIGYTRHMDTPIIPITDFIRKFGEYADKLSTVDKLILTRDGRPFAEVKLTPSEKNKSLVALSGIWKGTDLDSDGMWEKIRVRKNRKNAVSL